MCQQLIALIPADRNERFAALAKLTNETIRTLAADDHDARFDLLSTFTHELDTALAVARHRKERRA